MLFVNIPLRKGYSFSETSCKSNEKSVAQPLFCHKIKHYTFCLNCHLRRVGGLSIMHFVKDMLEYVMKLTLNC